MIDAPQISPLSTSAPAKAPSVLSGPAPDASSIEQAREIKEAFGQFVGETFFGQMLKSMRATVGEPAYFHGGHAEEQFQARLDQHLAQDLAASGTNSFADEMFESQFPKEAKLLNEATAGPSPSLEDLTALRRR